MEPHDVPARPCHSQVQLTIGHIDWVCQAETPREVRQASPHRDRDGLPARVKAGGTGAWSSHPLSPPAGVPAFGLLD